MADTKSALSPATWSPMGGLQAFLDGKTPAGAWFEALTVVLILGNVACFVVSTDEDINHQLRCDATENLDPRCVLDVVEVVTVVVFTLEFIARLLAVPARLDAAGRPLYPGSSGPLVWILTDPFAWVDLAAIVPFYVDRVVPGDLPALQFVRLFRLLLLLTKDPRYYQAYLDVCDILHSNRHLLATSGSCGLAVWLITASLYYLAERSNPAMYWCVPDGCPCWEPVEALANTTWAADGCENLGHRFETIPLSMYHTLLNMFGEFPLVDKNSDWGKVVATFTAILSVAVFAIPTGILGGGFAEKVNERLLKKKAEGKEEKGSARSSGGAPSLRDLGAMPAPLSALDDDWLTAGLLAGTNGVGRAYKATIYAVIAADVVAYIVGGTDPHDLSPGVAAALTAVEVVSVCVLCLDLGLRCMHAASTDTVGNYVLSRMFVVDVLSVLPFFVGLCIGKGMGIFHPVADGQPFTLTYDFPGGLWIQALTLIRMLKAERYMNAFGVFNKVISDNSDVLVVTGFAAVVMWVFTSTIMYYCERNNRDPLMQKYYTSVPRAMWVTLLNLSGESPIADYSTMGKFITAFVGVFAVGFFAIPISARETNRKRKWDGALPGLQVGVLGAGFEEFVAGEEEEEEGSESGSSKMDDPPGENNPLLGNATLNPAYQAIAIPNASPAESDGLPEAPPREVDHRVQVYKFLEGKTAAGGWFLNLIFMLILWSVVQAILETVPGLSGGVMTAFAVLEWATVLLFTAEYLLRLYAAPADRAYRRIDGDALRRLRHAVSFYGAVDLLAVLPFFITVAGAPLAQRYEGLFRMLRMLRLLKFERYLPGLTLIGDVFRNQAEPLLLAGYVTSVVWMFFTALFYIFERKDEDDLTQDLKSVTHETKFHSVATSLHYVLIHLSGDFPQMDYSFPTQVTAFFLIVAGVGIVGVPFGLIASGFMSTLEARRDQDFELRTAGALAVQRAFRGYLARKRLRGVVRDATLRRKADKRRRQMAALEEESTVQKTERWLYDAFFSMQTTSGYVCRRAILVLIALNVTAVLLESVPSINEGMGASSAHTSAPAFQWFEAVSVGIFTLEYLLHIATAPVSSQFGFSRVQFLTSFWGIVDLATIVPFYFELVLSAAGVHWDSTPFRVIRMLRILQLEQFLESFTLLDDAWRDCKDTVSSTGILAIMIWVVGSTMFWLTERHEDPYRFDTIPNSLAHVATILAGDWPTADFTWGGQIVCMLFVVVGIGLFAIPVGTVFEAFEDVLTAKQEAREARQQVEVTFDGDSKLCAIGITAGPVLCS